MSDINSIRRYYLGERLNALFMGEEGLAAVWRYKQESIPGSPLPSDFPFSAELAKRGYTTVEDVWGADSRELQMRAYLPARDAELVVTRIAALVNGVVGVVVITPAEVSP